MSTLEKVVNTIKKNEEVIKKKFKVREIGIFGSVVRGEETERSDIDIVVEFESGGKNFDNYMELKFFLEELLGASVDLVSKSAIKERLKSKILEEVVYV
ncbi:nucleotidyltransferase [Archaeoglobales archaeon]|nr:MAG: nucleotidyltransferase [Archaeoglobales archaeon]